MSIRQLTELKRDYIPWDRDFGRAAFARKFGCSVQQIDYWLSPPDQLERRRKWRSRKVAGLGPQLFPDLEDSAGHGQSVFLLSRRQPHQSAGPDVAMSARLGNPRTARIP